MDRQWRYQDTKTARYLKGIVVLFLLWIASGCAIVRSEGQTPSPVTMINELAARNQAIKIASTVNFHFTGVVGPISNVREEVMTFQTAIHYMEDQQMSCSYDATKDKTGWFWVLGSFVFWPWFPCRLWDWE